MASKNPIKGYILCPTSGCGEVCTVHAVGEHKALTQSEPPKNPRRLGQLYTICPKCKTNQQSGKPFQEWLTNHMQPTAQAVTDAVSEPVKTVTETIDPDVTDLVTEEVTGIKPSLTSENNELTDIETKPDETDIKPPLTDWVNRKPNLLALGALIAFCVGLFFLLTRKPKEKTA